MNRHAILAALLLASGARAQTNLLINGSFEEGPIVAGYLTLNPGSTALPGWTVTANGNVDIVQTSWASADGLRSMDLNGNLPGGGIEQAFATMTGREYVVGFDMAGNPTGGAAIKVMRVEVVGGPSADFEFDVTCLTLQAMAWKRSRWSFVAIAPVTTLRFTSQSLTGCCWGPGLDDVVVQDTTTTVSLSENYCESAPNGTYCAGARIRAEGSLSVSDNTFELVATRSVPGSFGLFYYGGGAVQMPFGAGFRCVGPGGIGVFRLTPTQMSNSDGTTTKPVDFTQPPVPSGAITGGSSWKFQYWYRDTAAPSGFNLSDAVDVTFCP